MYKPLFLLTAAIMLCAFFGSCGGDDGPSPEEAQLQSLTATWQLGSVDNDNQDVSDQFTGFSLTVNADKTFSTTQGGNPWPAQGTFDFVNGNVALLQRDDGVNIQVSNLTDDRLVLTFTMSSVRGSAHGAEGITGNFIFDLTKTN